MDAQTHQEGSPWFWKLFGGGIIGLIGVLLMIIITNLNNNLVMVRAELAQTKNDNEKEIDKLKDEISDIKTKSAATEEFKNTNREKLVALESDLKEFSKYYESLKEKLLILDSKLDKLSPKEESK